MSFHCWVVRMILIAGRTGCFSNRTGHKIDLPTGKRRVQGVFWRLSFSFLFLFFCLHDIFEIYIFSLLEHIREN